MAISRLDRNELVPFSDKQYAKTQWMDGNRPAINAENLLKIESGLYELYRYLCTGTGGTGQHYQNLIKISDTLNLIIDALNNEVSIRDSQTTSLSSRIDGEIDRARTAEGDIQREIGEETDTAGHTVNINNQLVSTVHGRIAKICEQLELLIDAERDRAMASESVLTSSIAKETADRITADQNVASEVTVQYKKYTDDAKKEINDKIGDPSSTDNTVYGVMNSYKSELLEDLADEVARAKSQEGLLSSQLISEATRATTVENEIKATATTNKSELTALINAEVNRATTKENSIESKLQEDVQSLSDRIDTNSELIRLSDATAVATEVVEIRGITNNLIESVNNLTLYDLNSDADDVLTILDGGEPPQ